MKWKNNESATIPPSDVELEVETDSGERHKAILEDGIIFRIVGTCRHIMEGVAKWREHEVKQ